MPCWCGMMRRCAVVGDLMAMRLARLRSGCFFRGGSLLVRGGGSLAFRCGGRKSRFANRHTRECRDSHLDNLLIHVTPTFLGFLP